MKNNKHLISRDAYRQFYINQTHVSLRPIRDYFRKMRARCGLMPKSFRAFSQLPRYQCVENEIKKRNLKNILDVGCGQGLVSTLLAHRLDVSVTGVDLSPTNIAKAKALCWIKSVNFHEIFAEDLSKFAPPGSFDCILLLEILEHVIDVNEILMAVNPLLAPDGLVLITLPNDEHVNEQSAQHVREFNEQEIHKIFADFPDFDYDLIPEVPGVYAGGYFVRFKFPR